MKHTWLFQMRFTCWKPRAPVVFRLTCNSLSQRTVTWKNVMNPIREHVCVLSASCWLSALQTWDNVAISRQMCFTPHDRWVNIHNASHHEMYSLAATGCGMKMRCQRRNLCRKQLVRSRGDNTQPWLWFILKNTILGVKIWSILSLYYTSLSRLGYDGNMLGKVFQTSHSSSI